MRISSACAAALALASLALALPFAPGARAAAVKEGVPWSKLVRSWGSFKPDPISLNEVTGLRKTASELVDKVGFADGPSS